MSGTFPNQSGNESGQFSTIFPDYDAANGGTIQGMLEQFAKYQLRNTDDMLPAHIVAYDRATNLASVQPQIRLVRADGTISNRAPVASVPVLALGGGGFFISFPLVAGARGWIKASDRDISLYMQSSQNAAPNTMRMHSFSDGMFIPDVINGYTINSEDAGNMVLQNTSGSVRVALWPNKVKITAPTIDLSCTNLTVEGNTAFTGNVTANGHNIGSTHVHTNGGGTGNSGPPP